MWEMKGDMAGAAAVLFTMRALGRMAPDVKVMGILCCAENLPDANAQRPGDIFTAKNGKSVMVDNTDAEGRLVLTDGLARAGEEGATHIVDIATLTGAVVRALGPSVAGILGTDRELIQRVIRSGENHGEAFWELPLVDEYREALKTPTPTSTTSPRAAWRGPSRPGSSCASSCPRARPGPTSTSRAPCSGTRTGSTTKPAPWASG